MQRRLLRANSNPFDLPDNRFIELFRLNKEVARNLITGLTPHLNQRQYQSGIRIDTKVLTALRFYATGCYQRAVGEDYHYLKIRLQQGFHTLTLRKTGSISVCSSYFGRVR